jgi:hypothetical protein
MEKLIKKRIEEIEKEINVLEENVCRDHTTREKIFMMEQILVKEQVITELKYLLRFK